MMLKKIAKVVKSETGEALVPVHKKLDTHSAKLDNHTASLMNIEATLEGHAEIISDETRKNLRCLGEVRTFF